MSKDDAYNLMGCLVSAWSLLVTTPMWLVLMFGVLSRIDAPSWMWVLYWCYVPVSLLGIIFIAIMRSMKGL